MALPSSPAAGRSVGRGNPSLIPCMMLRAGLVCLPGEEGPEVARDQDGKPLDPFDVLDHLVPDYPWIYLVDLTGIERGEAQLDYLQELARDATIWVDAGVRTVDQAIDALVTGAQRAVLSSSRLEGPDVLRQAWKLSTELVFEVEVEGGAARAGPGWGSRDPGSVARAARGSGPDHLVISTRDAGPDWGLVQALASEGPSWVAGTFSRGDLPRLRDSGAVGGIFHLDELPEYSPGRPLRGGRGVRDDET